MPKTKASLWVIAATLVTVVTLFLVPVSPRTAVRTALVERGELIRPALLEGVVSYLREQPLVSPQAGRIARVHVRQGQQVQAGELLISMDTSLQEQELAEISGLLYRQEQALTAMSEAGGAVLYGMQNGVEARKTQELLQAAIKAGQIRAAEDGVVGALYAAEGDYTEAAGLLGTVHGTEKCVVAAGRAAEFAGVLPGAAALVTASEGQPLGAAVLCGTGAPELDGTTLQAMQSLSFLPADADALSQARIGDRVMVEVVCEVVREGALLPISAVDRQDRAWFVEDGKAVPVQVDISIRNDEFVAVPPEWAGRRVVLCPEEKTLYAGCPVKEAKKP